ncbi:BMC domain-containing protein [Secundilactobacillus hailunensis]|uniref:BMC domain-containing protein n=1 Tax=Secundilactobacillus hailunensis TaxID=2559923 RepID=A0ABW1TBE2_9LACO|nr:BMC domain-containing protein [Secundilactobacillus hailunensis]
MKSLGYLEVEGLTTGIFVADKMLKTADVELQPIQSAMGSGWSMISITGDVAAVQVSIEAGKEAAGDHVISSVVIPNPAEGIPGLGDDDAILGNTKPQPKKTTYPINKSAKKSESVAPTRPKSSSTTTRSNTKPSSRQNAKPSPKPNTKSTGNKPTDNKANNSKNNRNNNNDK